MMEASQPATPVESTRAMGSRPSAWARSALITAMPEAPTESAEEVPAVTVPPRGSNTGLSSAILSRLASARITSSRCTRIRRPSASCPSTPMISRSKPPRSMAAWARWWERTPKASCSSREMPCILPSSSAVRPIIMAALAACLLAAGLMSTPWVMGTCSMCSTPPIT